MSRRKSLVTFEYRGWDITCYTIIFYQRTVTFIVRILGQMQRERW